MGQSSNSHLVVYDISVDRERRKVADVMEEFGFRVQRSAFEVRLDRASLARLRQRLTALELKSGFILIYRVDDAVPREDVGIMPQQPLSDDHHAMIG